LSQQSQNYLISSFNVTILSILSTIALSAVLFSFVANKTNHFPDDLPSAYVEKFSKEYLKTVKSEGLNTQLEKNFGQLFDKVDYLHGQYSKIDETHYYIAFGKKDGVDKIELFKVNEEDIKNETYTYIDFSKSEQVNVRRLYCREGGLCPSFCDYHVTNCLGYICGIWDFDIGDCRIIIRN